MKSWILHAVPASACSHHDGPAVGTQNRGKLAGEGNQQARPEAPLTRPCALQVLWKVVDDDSQQTVTKARRCCRAPVAHRVAAAPRLFWGRWSAVWARPGAAGGPVRTAGLLERSAVFGLAQPLPPRRLPAVVGSPDHQPQLHANRQLRAARIYPQVSRLLVPGRWRPFGLFAPSRLQRPAFQTCGVWDASRAVGTTPGQRWASAKTCLKFRSSVKVSSCLT